MEIKRFDDFIICPIPAESELDQVEIEKNCGSYAKYMAT